jgi:hypothetical protein
MAVVAGMTAHRIKRPVNTRAATISAVAPSLSRGKGSSGIGFPRNLHKGSQPSPSRITSSLSFGMLSMIRWL